ncbi:hypothetical protein [Vallitalea okinawensis]|uniref:hypothetical protein n=1 Tax=Vallitalea okinawensis TaxID=2078660 RepID=UPI0013005098|nr:hypothetical protein [Vallitalea okinawensis]
MNDWNINLYTLGTYMINRSADEILYNRFSMGESLMNRVLYSEQIKRKRKRRR